tara:strand:+ start:179 stop:1099 length:921 start_codon:yes stop_codon:yes gene_type:complete
MSGFLDNFKDGTGIKLAAQGAQVAWATGQAIHSNIKYKEKMDAIENFQRQEIINPFQNLSNPYANLQVATKAAEMQAEQSDIALANTLDNLRETGAGGATALAQAALKSKQGVSANIQQQETQNQKLQAKGQLQVDIAKGKGESWRTSMQERREIQELDRMQGQADLLRAQQLYSTQAAVAGLGAMGETLGGGMLPPQIPETSNYTGDIQTLDLAGGDYAVTPGDFGIGGGGQGMLVNPMMQFAVKGPRVPGATDLYQYYKGINKPYPTDYRDRAPLYEQAGLGTAGSYTGSEKQNDALLEYLQNQ